METSAWSKKRKTHDRIVAAWTAADLLVEHAIRLSALLTDTLSEDAARECSDVLRRAAAEADATFQKCWDVDEWLTRACADFRGRQRRSPVFRDSHDGYHTSWHSAAIADAVAVISRMVRAAEVPPASANFADIEVSPDVLIAQQREIAHELDEDLPNFAMHRERLRAEAYWALGLWESSSRTDKDEESETGEPPKKAKPSTSLPKRRRHYNRDKALLDEFKRDKWDSLTAFAKHKKMGRSAMSKAINRATAEQEA